MLNIVIAIVDAILVAISLHYTRYDLAIIAGVLVIVNIFLGVYRE